MTKNRIAKFLTPQQIKFLTFFATSLATLILDIGIYSILVFSNTNVFLANCVSSSIGVSANFLLSCRFVGKRSPTHKQFLLFIGYYALSIAFFSSLINLVVQQDLLTKELAKIASLPFSFLINYYMVTTFIFGEKNPGFNCKS